jgi:hypothetical protein
MSAWGRTQTLNEPKFAHHVHLKLPAIYFLCNFADDGGLMSYGGSPNDAYRLAGIYAGRSYKPCNASVEQGGELKLLSVADAH